MHQVERWRRRAQVLVVRENQSGNPGAHGEDQAAGERGQHDRARDGLARILCLLRQRRHGVEAEERQGEDGAAGREVRKVRALAKERVEEPNRLRVPGQVAHARNHKDDDEDDLRSDQRQVHVGDQVDADEIEDGHEQHGHDDPYPERDGRQHGGHVLADQYVAEDGQQEVVEQERPSGHEAEMAAECLLRVRVRRSSDRILAHHVGVAVRGEEHGNRREHVGAGEVSRGGLGGVAVAGEDCEGEHVGEAEDEQSGCS